VDLADVLNARTPDREEAANSGDCTINRSRDAKASKDCRTHLQRRHNREELRRVLAHRFQDRFVMDVVQDVWVSE
jgi:hypothetical protein